MLEINTIFCGDCLEYMRQIPDKAIDLILTDPPYGIKRDKGFAGAGGFDHNPIQRTTYNDDWDSAKPEKIYFDEIFRISKNQIIFGGNFFTDIIPQCDHWIVWHKENTMPTFGDCELAWTSFSQYKSVSLFKYRWNGLMQGDMAHKETRVHPTQKPLPLMEWCLQKYSNPGDLVMDPFLGSGTTAVASQKLGRNYIGIEKEQTYVDIAKKRLEKVNNHKITDFFN